MNVEPRERHYSIREAAALSGLPASTLRYYEQRGVIPPARRSDSGYRTYSRADVDMLLWVGCLAAAGMPVTTMREYVANGALGPRTAAEQARLLMEHDARLAREQRILEQRRQYVQLKTAYWRAVEVGRDREARDLAARAAGIGETLRGLDSSNSAED